MDYKEAVERKIRGEGSELDRRKRLWGQIADANRRGGENSVKSILIEEYGDRIAEEFARLLEQLRKKL